MSSAAHEESFDGSGYPAGLSGDEIPLEARIVACAIAFVRLARMLGADGAARELERGAGSALDPEVVTATLRLRSDGVRHPRDVPAG